MRNFVKNNFRTIIFFMVIALIIGGIFLYEYILDHSGVYEPNNGPVDYEIKKYEDNQYDVKYIDTVDVYKAYYREFIRLLVTKPDEAFNKLTPECKELSFGNDYNKYLEFTKKIDKNIVYTGEVVRYSESDGKIIMIDNTDSSYTFVENGVWNYTVRINGHIK